MSSTKRLIAVAVALVGMLLAALSFGASALAAPTDYGSGTSPIVTTQTPPEGGQVGVSGQGCAPGETIDISLDNGAFDLGSTTTDSTGAYNTTVTLPAGVTGVHTINVIGESSGCSGAAAINIGAVGSGGGSGGESGGGGLASTGVAVAGIGAVGLVLLVGGGLMLMAGRRRKATI